MTSNSEFANYVRAVSQFVGRMIGGWNGIVISVGSREFLTSISGGYETGIRVDAKARGIYWEDKRSGRNIGVISTGRWQMNASDMARTLFHEQLHSVYGTGRSAHSMIDYLARLYTRVSGLNGSGCTAVGNYPGCSQ